MKANQKESLIKELCCKEGGQGMIIKQLSVFLENKEGSLWEVTETLGKNGINITALSLADTSDFGVLRLMVSDPEGGRLALKEAGFSAMLTDVICIQAAHKAGTLNRLLKNLREKKIEIEYMYAFATGKEASLVFKTSDVIATEKTLLEVSLDIK